MKSIIKISVFILILATFNSCKGGKFGGLNVFSLDQDKELGLNVSKEIAKNPSQYPILDEKTYASSYTYLKAIRDRILNSGKVEHKADFLWEVKIIKDDKTLNAFCTPGGYIYVYTGLIKYLDTEDQLAGVMGHEIAHADCRHSTDAMTQQYGMQLLLDIALGKNQGALTQMASNLLSLKYSRSNETEADAYSVKYLSGTPYQCSGAAGFFEKIKASGEGNGTPAFLSTHPSPETRIADIHAKAKELGCKTNPSGYDYAAFKKSLP